MLPILIESIEVAGRIKGCTFILMLFFDTPLTIVLAVTVHSSQGKRQSQQPLKSRFITVSTVVVLQQDGP